MKRIGMAGLVCCLALALAWEGAFAAEVKLSPGVAALKAADQALEETYGVTRAMQTYFVHWTKEQPDGSVTVVYEGTESLAYVLGAYTITVKDGGAVSAAWSREGQSTEGGFEADAWGKDQIEEMLRLNQESGTAPFDGFVEKINERHGLRFEPEAPAQEETDAGTEEFSREAEEIRARSRFTREEMDLMAREAVIEVYGLTQAQADLLLFDDSWQEEDGFYEYLGEKPCYCTYLFLSQKPFPDDPYSREEFVEMDGTYFVHVNVETGVIESMNYESGLGGNG